jgi:hypothetical protein
MNLGCARFRWRTRRVPVFVVEANAHDFAASAIRRIEIGAQRRLSLYLFLSLFKRLFFQIRSIGDERDFVVLVAAGANVRPDLPRRCVPGVERFGSFVVLEILGRCWRKS